MRKGLIVIGYQGIGKSSCAGKNGCIDLESGNFWIGEKRSDDWYIPYCHIAMHLANQGYTVFTSSHEVVWHHLMSMPRLENVGAIVVFCPTLRMKDEWIQRLSDRLVTTNLYKDYKALKNAEGRYAENILELVNCGLPVYQPASIDYDLMVYVHKMRRDHCGETD